MIGPPNRRVPELEHTWFLCCAAGADAGGWHAGQDKWRVGQVEVLQPEDEEPFILASVKRGQTRMAVDTYMFKTGDPACKAAQTLPKKPEYLHPGSFSAGWPTTLFS